ncbi:MAG TPA: response regulator [Opitutaceae bacterium]|nr:response regulator [Opitutaceae bacterium]
MNTRPRYDRRLRNPNPRDQRPPLRRRAAEHRVLVIDDDPEVRNMLAELLGRAGYRVDLAEDGRSAWVAMRDAHYDLLLTDHQMPGLCGTGLIWRLDAAGITIPVIMISGLACVEVINPASTPAPWFKAFLQKPFRPRELLETVRFVLGGGDPLHADPMGASSATCPAG